jgi:lysophospholipase L1-like esterase
MPQATPKPTYRAPSLAIFALGINDMQGTALTTQGSPTTAELDALNRAANFLAQSVEHFIKLTRNAGADPLVVIPHYQIAQNNHSYSGAFITATAGVCVAHGVPMIDFNQALGPVTDFASKGYTVAVHTNETAYNAEATFLYNALRDYFTAA